MANARKTQSDDMLVVRLVPEKKGLFLKHSEYEIVSQKFKCSVIRRYNDFATFHAHLLTKYPYRMIPRLPPKQLMLDSLLEERRRGLQRWLKIVSRHPTLAASQMLINFITDASSDHQDHLREIFVTENNEFEKLSNDTELPVEDQGRLASNRETMRTMLNSVARLKRLMDQHAARIQNQSKDMADMSGIVGSLASSEQIFGVNTFSEMTNRLDEVSSVSAKYANIQHNSICERLSLMLEVLTGHSDLCDRVEKGIVSEHQKALTKMLSLNKQKMKGVIRGTAAESVAAMHEKEVAQTGVVGTLGRRSAFSLQCVLDETLLAHKYLESLPSLLLAFAHEENVRNRETSDIWERIVTEESAKLNQ